MRPAAGQDPAVREGTPTSTNDGLACCYPQGMASKRTVAVAALGLCMQAAATGEPALPAKAASASVSSAPASARAPQQTHTAVALAPQRFERAKLAFDGLADVTPELTSWDVGGVFFQGRRLATNDEAIRLLLRAHGDESLDDFARDHQGYTIAERTPIQICGRRAEMIRATRAEQHIACVIVKDANNHPAYIPPTEIVAVGFKHAQLGVVMTLEIRAADPALYKDLRDKILKSIRCL